MAEVDGFFGTEIREEIKISEIFTIHYFEYTKDFHFVGERHNFWEFLYVDRGVVEVVANHTQNTLFKGDIIFHKPQEFHNLWANGKTAPNLVVVTFDCKSPACKWFTNKILRIQDEERNLLGKIIHEAQRAFSSPFDDPYSKGLERKENQSFASEQMIKIHLEEFLLRLIRRDKAVSKPIKMSNVIERKTKERAFNKVVNYMDENLSRSFLLDELCLATGYSRSYLHKVVKEHTGRSIMEYYKRVKLERVKQMIREGSNNFTQICDLLNYTSLQHLSKVFKRYIGMTPSEYSSSVKVKSDFSNYRNTFTEDENPFDLPF